MFNKKLIFLGVMLVSIIAYIVVINLSSNVISENLLSSDNTSFLFQDNSQDVKLTVGDLAQVSVKRPRFYGTYYEYSSTNGKEVVLYLMNFVKLPIEKNNFMFIYIHITFSIVVLAFIVLIIIVPMKGGTKENERVA